jgi:hypothetical protein
MPNVDRPSETVLSPHCCGRCESFEWIPGSCKLGQCADEQSSFCGEGIVLMVTDGQRCKQFKEGESGR